MEQLKVIEIDRVRGIAILRSDSPKNNSDEVKYYQVNVDREQHIAIQRMKAAKSTHACREAIPFALTHEVVAKMVEDMIW